jgi:hypothetical protein
MTFMVPPPTLPKRPLPAERRETRPCAAGKGRNPGFSRRAATDWGPIGGKGPLPSRAWPRATAQPPGRLKSPGSRYFRAGAVLRPDLLRRQEVATNSTGQMDSAIAALA